MSKRIIETIKNLKEIIITHKWARDGGKYNKDADTRATWILNGDLHWLTIQLHAADKKTLQDASRIATRMFCNLHDEIEDQGIHGEDLMDLRTALASYDILTEMIDGILAR